MDVSYFLRQRMAFISHYYDIASAPFLETMQKIEAEEFPYEPPSGDPESMSTEPAFLEEWLQAQAGAEVAGLTCVSMLSEALKAFFVTHAQIAGLDCTAVCGPKIFKQGFVYGYRECFAKHGIDWSTCPADFDVLEQIVLARNSSQHSSSLTAPHVKHSRDTLNKHSNPLFINGFESELLSQHGGSWLTEPTVHVTRATLDAALAEMEKLANWVDED